MKIKIIDLLNKIANGEKVPKKIMFDTWLYTYNEREKTYYNEEEETLWQNYNFRILPDEVEIIEEEPKKIEYPILHKTAPSETTGDQMPNWRNLIDCNFEYLNKTICQLIDEINNLKEE